jgi:hypothetical protein
MRHFKVALILAIWGGVSLQPAHAQTTPLLLLQRGPIRLGTVKPAKPVLQPLSWAAPTSSTTPPPALANIPRWKATDLPVFCRIEHEMGRKLPVMVKFRLGSVEYVDQLEGK